MKLRLRYDPQDRKNTLIELDGKDLTACTNSVALDLSVDDMPRVIIEAIAADKIDVDVEVGTVNIIERAFQVAHPNGDLTNTPLRELLDTYEEKPKDATS